MNTTLFLLLLFIPLISSLINFSVGHKFGNFSGIIASLAVFISFLLTLFVFIGLINGNPATTIDLFEWMDLQQLSVSFGFSFDRLSVLWLMFVTGIGALIHLYSTAYMKGDENYHKFFAYLNLFIFFMMMLVCGKNLLIMFIGWEGVGLCSYLLIGFWHKNQDYNDAAKKAFIMNRIGDLGFLVGIFIIAYLFNTLDFESLRDFIVNKGSNYEIDRLLGWATLALFVGAMGKSAQIPLYTWLPDAMAGPTPVSALIHAATMVTAGIFMITKLNFLFDLTPYTQDFIAIIGAFTALFAATIGLVQNDIKKVLAYSTVSQLGLMFLALGFGAYEVAVFHVITHAFFKACLFLGSGSIIHGMSGDQDIRNMGNLKKYMPVTYLTFLLASLAISGIPPFSGFFSKDEILMSAFNNNKILWVIASIASIMTAFYMFRALFLTFMNDFRGTQEQKNHLHESPVAITIPLLVLAVLSVLGGIIGLPGNNWLNRYLEPVILNNASLEVHHLGATEYILMGVAIVGGIFGIVLACRKYLKSREVPPQDRDIVGFHKVLYDKYYIDEIYQTVIVKPLYGLSVFFRENLELFLSNIVFGFAELTLVLSNTGKKIQNGNVGLYLIFFVLGVCGILYYLFIAI